MITFARTWAPVDPKDLALKRCPFDRSADAEVLFERDVISDKSENLSTQWDVYRRVKIFDKAGSEKQSQLIFDYPTNNVVLSNLRVRVIHPNGRIEEISSRKFVTQVSSRGRNRNRRRKVLAIPNVEPGAILDYRYRFEMGIIFAKQFHMQGKLPIRQISFRFWPGTAAPGVDTLNLKSIFFHAPKSLKHYKDHGWYVFEAADIPPSPDEPHMLPSDAVTSWIMEYYSTEDARHPDIYWKRIARDVYLADSKLRVNRLVRRTAAKIIAGARSDDEKAHRIYAYCRTKIRHISTGGDADANMKRLRHQSITDALRSHESLDGRVDGIFLTLCRAAGLQAKTLLLPDRAWNLFNKSVPERFFLPSSSVMVKVGKTWRVCDPGNDYLPYGRLCWQETGGLGLPADPHRARFMDVPMLSPSGSQAKHSLMLVMDANGSIHGHVKISLSGYLADRQRIHMKGRTAVEWGKKLRDQVNSRIPSAEVTDIKFSQVDDPTKPLLCDFDLSIPDYAERVGSRLIFQPAVWEKGRKLEFPSSTRKTTVYFPFLWSELDNVNIVLPKGFHFESPAKVNPINTKYLGYGQAMDFNPKTRIFRFGRGFGCRQSVVEPKDYAKMKAIWDTVARADRHVLVLKSDTNS